LSGVREEYASGASRTQEDGWQGGRFPTSMWTGMSR
jgi:hypothetical protein